jgi:hypothetical protein
VRTDDAASQYTETQLFDGHVSSPPVFVRDGSRVRGALWRTISSGLSTTSLCPLRPLIRSRSILADLAPMSSAIFKPNSAQALKASTAMVSLFTLSRELS